MEPEFQKAIAYLIGRAVAAEKALQTAVASPKRGAELAEIMKVNLQISRSHLGTNIALAELPAALLPAAEEGFDVATKAALRGAASGKYVLPDRR